MKRFRFGLDRVRRLRGRQERAARVAMAQELATLRGLAERDARLEANLEECTASQQGAHLMALTRAFEAGASAARRRIAVEIAAASQRLEGARAEYRERRRELLTLDELFDRRYEAWRRGCVAEEQAELDEVSRLLPRTARVMAAGPARGDEGEE